MEQEQPLEYKTGAVRSGRLPKYRLIPASFKTAVAEAFTEGNGRYEIIKEILRLTPLTSNWRKGDLNFFLDAGDHLDKHVSEYNDKLLELGLYLQLPNPTSPEESELRTAAVDAQVKQLVEELGHAGANIAFLVEWLTSGAGLQMLVREVIEVGQLREMLATIGTPITSSGDLPEPDQQMSLELVEVPPPEEKPITALERFVADAHAKAVKERDARLAAEKK